jgi:putative spermidine/putrescine transport system substrate-binding protein
MCVRRRPLAALLMTMVVLTVAAGCGGDGGRDDPARVVFDSWGGDFQKAQAELLLSPFSAETGIPVVQLSDGESIYAKVKSQAGRRTGEIDLVHGDASWLMRGKREKLWASVDYSALGDTKIYDDARDDSGVGILYWSFNIVFDPARFPVGPTTWAQVWEYARKHPKRVAMWGARPNYVLEAALMADGLAPGQVYPLTDDKIDRAYAKLAEIKDAVVWYESGAQGGRLFEEKQVDVGMFYGGDAFSLKVDGRAPTVVWNQGLYTRDYWLVPANAPHKQQAIRLIAYAVDAQRQARFAERTGYGPVSPDAVNLLDETSRTRMTSLEPQKSQQLSYDYTWWGENDDAQLERWTTWLRG